MSNELKSLREARGWSQGAMADRLQVSRQTVNALETGRYDPSLPLAVRIAQLFDRPIEGGLPSSEDVVAPARAQAEWSSCHRHEGPDLVPTLAVEVVGEGGPARAPAPVPRPSTRNQVTAAGA